MPLTASAHYVYFVINLKSFTTFNLNVDRTRTMFLQKKNIYIYIYMYICKLICIVLPFTLCIHWKWYTLLKTEKRV